MRSLHVSLAYSALVPVLRLVLLRSEAALAQNPHFLRPLRLKGIHPRQHRAPGLACTGLGGLATSRSHRLEVLGQRQLVLLDLGILLLRSRRLPVHPVVNLGPEEMQVECDSLLALGELAKAGGLAVLGAAFQTRGREHGAAWALQVSRNVAVVVHVVVVHALPRHLLGPE